MLQACAGGDCDRAREACEAGPLPAPRSALVSWIPPLERTDGSALTDLAGYRVYFGRAPDALVRIIEIRNPGQTSQFIDNLEPGAWYFAVTAFSRDGLESEKSAIASKTVH